MTASALVGLAALVAAPVVPPPVPVAPWGYEAHRLVCEIAWREMTPAARAAADTLLANDRPWERFSDVCPWADQVRGDPAYADFVTAHYMNVPPGRTRIDPTVDCPETYCVVEAIRELSAVLGDGAQPAARRRDALRFLVHLVADVHQPLHVGRPDDRGGNDVTLQFFGESTNLHTLWDAGLVQRALLDPWDARRLVESLSTADREAWADLDPVTWATESYRIVERDVYRDVAPGAQLGDEYADRHAAVVEQRLVQAGYRLGLLLNRLLAG